MKRLERQWMYERFDVNKKPNIEYAKGVLAFLKVAKEHADLNNRPGQIKCPCAKCDNRVYLPEPEVRNHLYSKGFCSHYYIWTFHGEVQPTTSTSRNVDVVQNPYIEFVENALRPVVDQIMEDRLNPDDISDEEIIAETPNPTVASFFEMLRNAEQPLYEGSRVCLLQAAARLLTLKCEYNLSLKCVDGIASLIGDIIPKDNTMTRSFYDIKKVLKGLKLPVEKIDACIGGCMLFWRESLELDSCTKCGEERYKGTANSRGKRIPRNVLTYFPLAPRLQRLYATKQIAGLMSWHYKNSRSRSKGTMTHPSDSEAWKHMDTEYPLFANEPRNVRLGLCTDGFAPYGQFGKSYSCWPVILTPYNLPPWLCMKKQFMFLSLIVPGPKNPKANMDVYMQPLIEELKGLWETGVNTFDVSTRTNFVLKAVLLWTINDFPAYGMLSGWTTTGYRACPYCLEKDNMSSWLKASGKVTWFDCSRQFLPIDHPFRNNCNHFRKSKLNEFRVAPSPLKGDELWNAVKYLPKVVDATNDQMKKLKSKKEGWWKQSIFWELPYWKKLLIRHNLDVMHIEKNFFEMLINTVMDEPKKTCFGIKGKKDFNELCFKRPKSSRFFLEKAEKKVLCEWVSKLKFPDKYVSDLSRCVDNTKGTLHGMKSHDCHVFMERLLPVAFRFLLPTNTWNGITEISQFFRDLCASTITVESISRLKSNIPEIMCKLEKLFPPSFFNSMEHLPIHLPHEAMVGGPVQYRWMYPFERFLNHIKQKIGNKARVEGSICNAYLLEEISNFCSLYFENHIETKAKSLVDTDVDENEFTSNLPEHFQVDMGSTTGKCEKGYLSEEEHMQSHIYILRNCGNLLKVYEEEFEAHIMNTCPDISATDDVWSKHETTFAKWLIDNVDKIEIPFVKALAYGPNRRARSWRRYSINGYYFRAFKDGTDVSKSTKSNGVCVSSTDGIDYYGTLNKVVEVTYDGPERSYKTILFKCDWIDNSPRGQVVHDLYKLVDVNPKAKLRGHNPFVLAHQVDQVCYAPYPSTKKDNPWLAVFKVKARSQIDAPVDETLYQEDIMHTTHISPIVLDDIPNEEHYEVIVEGEVEEIEEDEGELRDVEDDTEHLEEDDEEDEEESLFSDTESSEDDDDNVSDEDF